METILTRALDQADSIPRRSSFTSATASSGQRIVNQSGAKRTLFHLRTVDEIRASFAQRDEGADRNAWLYSYNSLTVSLT